MWGFLGISEGRKKKLQGFYCSFWEFLRTTRTPNLGVPVIHDGVLDRKPRDLDSAGSTAENLGPESFFSPL